MGLFKRSTGSGDADTLTPAEAVAGVAVAAAYADDVMTSDEDASLAAHLTGLRLFRDVPSRDMEVAFRKAHAIARASGDAGLVAQATAALPDALKPTAFVVAADIVLGDADYGEEERGFLDDLRARLGIDDALAERVLEVLAIKHRT